MRIRCLKNITFLLIIIISINNAFAQTKDELQRKKQQNLEKLKYTNELLSKVRKTKKTSIHQLLILNKRIELRNNLIENINEEINELNDILAEKRFVVEMLKEDLVKIKKEYAKLIQYTYKNYRSYNKLMFILSSRDFNQAYRRIKYLKQYSDYRKKQAEIIQQMKDIIDKETTTIKEKIIDKKLLISNKNEENVKLKTEKEKRSEKVSKLRAKESELKKEIERRKRITADIEHEIQKIIEEEARKKKGKSLYYKLTPDEKIIADNFSKNKGTLPWPTKRGIITSRFGRHEHPVIRGVYVNNNGIDITTAKGEYVRAVFKGVVSKVIAIKGANYTVIIRHGNFLTVYNNLVNVRVKTGDKVNTKQIIGNVFYSKEENNAVMHMEIWRELNKLDPEIWLAKEDK